MLRISEQSGKVILNIEWLPECDKCKYHKDRLKGHELRKIFCVGFDLIRFKPA